MVTPTYPRREQVWSKQPLKPPLLIAISLQFKTNAKLVQQRFWYYHETNQQAWLSFAKGLSMFMQKRVISNVFAPFTMILGGKHWFLKITQGIDQNLCWPMFDELWPAWGIIPGLQQHAELTRLAQTLLHVQNIFWIVAEDSKTCSDSLLHLLMRYDIPFTYMATPKEH